MSKPLGVSVRRTTGAIAYVATVDCPACGYVEWLAGSQAMHAPLALRARGWTADKRGWICPVCSEPEPTPHRKGIGERMAALLGRLNDV